jgi:hypothetical protein
MEMDLSQYASIFRMSPSETAPILLELARQQAKKRRPADLLAQFTRDGFVTPSMLDQRLIHQIDGFALEAASLFEALQLSPVAPLASCSAIAPTSQDRTLSAVRALEVVSDPTNVLALECAKRLSKDPKQTVRLCTVHQVLRAQALPAKPGFSRHFRLFAMAEAGAGTSNDGFEVQAIIRHLSVFDSLFNALQSIGCTFPERRATLLLGPTRKVLGSRLRQEAQTLLPHIHWVEEGFPSAYYDGVRVLFGAKANNGEFPPLVDIGLFDWVAKLTSNKKFRFVASGCGIQLAPILFRAAP